MSGGFNDPLVGGGGSLVYPAIHSPNYVLGVTGWAIRKDGTAQFTGLVLIGGTFTGTNFILNSTGMFFYSGAPALGNLIASISNVSGTDTKGNVFDSGICSYQASGGATPTSVSQLLGGALNVGSQPQIAGTSGKQPAGINANTIEGVLFLGSGKAGSTDTAGFIQLFSATANGGLPNVNLGPNCTVDSNGRIYVGGTGGSDTFIQRSAVAQMDVNTILQLLNGSAPAVPAGGVKLAAVSGRLQIVPQSGAGIDVSTGATAGDILKITNTATSTGQATVRLIAHAGGDDTLGIEVSGDTANRFQVDSNGVINWGPGGGTTPDVGLQRNGPNRLVMQDSGGTNFPVGHLISVLAADTPITSTTPTTLATLNVTASGKYLVHGWIQGVNGASGTLQGQDMRFGGTCTVTSMLVRTWCVGELGDSASIPFATGVINALNASISHLHVPQLNETFWIVFEGIINVNAAGTLTWLAREGTSAADVSWTAKANSFLVLEPF